MYYIQQELGIIFIYMFVYGINEIIVEKYIKSYKKKIIYYVIYLIIGILFFTQNIEYL